LRTYDVAVPDPASRAWCDRILALPEMQAWTAAALQEPEVIDELDMEF
jgi:glutathione S-transferase